MYRLSTFHQKLLMEVIIYMYYLGFTDQEISVIDSSLCQLDHKVAHWSGLELSVQVLPIAILHLSS